MFLVVPSQRLIIYWNFVVTITVAGSGWVPFATTTATATATADDDTMLYSCEV